MKRLWAAALALGWAIAAPAHAGPLTASVLDSDDLAWFYNRPGASVEEVASAHNQCRGFGAMMVGGTATQPGPYGLAGDVIGAIASAGLAVAYVDDCMMSRGYRRFDIADTRLRDFQQRFSQLSLDQQAAYAGAETPPEGALARRWANTYWLASASDAPASTEPRNFTPHAVTVEVFNRWAQPRWIDAAQSIATPGANEAIVVLRLRSSAGRARLGFDRRTENGEAAFLEINGRQRWVGIEPQMRSDAAEPQTISFVIPPGTYSLGYFGTTRYDVSTFCYGTIAFNAAAGEVIDLGDFTIEHGGEAVDPLAPAPSARMRIDQPAITPERASALGLSAQYLSPATYTNNFPRMCQLFSRAYGFELPGAANWARQP
ncbi:MAG: hypothetical protein M0D54_06070 [Hyphomonadaceae bacterium JAD_PAG50586_4]|nr:MAG: hypothetical protein M0D54_06070 [Hyphomonadaceae bacterium JAD_PAG50586_4]